MATVEKARQYEQVSGVMKVSAIGQHASTHTPGGSDPVALSTLGGLTKMEILALINSVNAGCKNDLAGVELQINKGKKNGYCPLSQSGKVTTEYLPDIYSLPRIYTMDATSAGTVVQDIIGAAGTFFEQGMVIPVPSTISMSRTVTIPYVVASVKRKEPAVGGSDIIIRLYVKKYIGGATVTLASLAGPSFADNDLDLTIAANNVISTTLTTTKALTSIALVAGDQLMAQVIACGTTAEFLKVRIVLKEEIV